MGTTPSYANVFIGDAKCNSDSDCDLGEFCTEYSCDISTGTCNSVQDCSSCGAKIDLEIQADGYGQEIEWEIVNVDDGEKSLEGGPYVSNSFTTKSSCLPYGKYEFRINDSGNDGICCKYGNGYYKLSLDNEVLKEGGKFKKSEVTSFEISQKKSPPTLSPTDKPSNAPPPPLNPTFPPTASPTFPPTASPTKSPTKSPTFVSTKIPTTESTKSPTTASTNGQCAADGDNSKDCGSNKAIYQSCCSGLVCHKVQTWKCVKEENQYCAGHGTASRECGGWKKSASKCCPGLVCEGKKCIESPPTESPTRSPSNNPTDSPTESPTIPPTASPTKSPTKSPTIASTNIQCAADNDNSKDCGSKK